jgi:hypothetical protein
MRLAQLRGFARQREKSQLALELDFEGLLVDRTQCLHVSSHIIFAFFFLGEVFRRDQVHRLVLRRSTDLGNAEPMLSRNPLTNMMQLVHHIFVCISMCQCVWARY